MYYYCEICNMLIKPKSKSKLSKSINHKKLDKHKHIKLTFDNPNINNIDEIFYNHNKKYNTMYEYYLIRCEFKLFFNEKEDYGLISGKLTDNQTFISWKIYVENTINRFENDGFRFTHISQMSIITVCNKMDMTYDFYMKQNMPAVEWKLNQLINKDKKLINKLPVGGFIICIEKLKVIVFKWRHIIVRYVITQ